MPCTFDTVRIVYLNGDFEQIDLGRVMRYDFGAGDTLHPNGVGCDMNYITHSIRAGKPIILRNGSEDERDLSGPRINTRLVRRIDPVMLS